MSFVRLYGGGVCGVPSVMVPSSVSVDRPLTSVVLVGLNGQRRVARLAMLRLCLVFPRP